MGCCIAICQRKSDKEMEVSQSNPPDDKTSYAEAPDYLSSLPNEVLVKNNFAVTRNTGQGKTSICISQITKD